MQNVILSSQSAATVKKDTLSQPALEVQETSSQESSLESESDEEEDDYMDIWACETWDLVCTLKLNETGPFVAAGPHSAKPVHLS